MLNFWVVHPKPDACPDQPRKHTWAASLRPRAKLAACAQDNSLVQMPPWCNPWLLVAAGLSLGLHVVILYVPVLADIFSIVPLSPSEWGLVVLFSFPVVLIDEVGSPFSQPSVEHRAAQRSAAQHSTWGLRVSSACVRACR